MEVGKDPFLTEEEFQELVQPIFCHSLLHNMSQLTKRILDDLDHMDLLDNLPVQDKQMLLFLQFCSIFRSSGPLPELLNSNFLTTLHQAVTGILSSKLDKFHSTKLDKDNMLKLVSGLRLLLVYSVIISDKFTRKDAEVMLQLYFPRLPIQGSNRHAWDGWTKVLDLPDQQLETISIRNRKSFNYLSNKMDTQTDSLYLVLNAWKELDSKLKHLENFVISLLPFSYLSIMWSSSNPKVKMIESKFLMAKDEPDLLNLFSYLQNVRVESEFYSKPSVRVKMGLQ